MRGSASEEPTRGPRLLWVLAGLALAGSALAAGGTIGDLDGSLDVGQAHHVEVTRPGSAEVLTGLVSVTVDRPFASPETRAASGGWILAHPESVDVGERARLLDERGFRDPNGGVWGQRVLAIDGERAWAVPVGEVRHDATIGASYNFALVVDWDEVPPGEDVETSYRQTLALQG